MNTQAQTFGEAVRPSSTVDVQAHALRLVVPIGRALFAAIFIISSFGHFTRHSIDYAAQQGVPLASFAVPLSGVISLLGGLSVLLGYKARFGAWLLILFLVPVTLMMHNFWAVQDAAQAEMQRIMFMKNVTMLGGALLITYFGAGPLSVDDKLCRKT